MKKFFALGLLLAAMFGCVRPAAAWWPCYPLCGCDKKCSKCCASITIRQYNAFTPICCGSMSCDGCCPMNLQGCGAGMCGPGMLNCCASPCGPAAYDPYAMGAVGAHFAGCDGCGLGQLPAVSHPGMAPAPVYQAPAPTPMEGARPMSYMYNPYMRYPVQPVSYQPMFNPTNPPMPIAPHPVQMAVPYYWNSGR